MPRWRWILTQWTRRLWVRATLIGILGVFTAILSAVVQRYIPWDLPGTIGADAVDGILNIIASSMLAVTTFSLSVMISAYGSATSNVTPRATRLLMEDRLTQNVLSTFIGSFLFSIVGIVVLKIGGYGDRGRVILFIVTIGVIALIVVSLLRWIDHLTRLGRVGETTNRVERATREAIQDRLNNPYLGGSALLDAEHDVPATAFPVRAEAVGYVQYVDMAAMNECAEGFDCNIFLASIPGAFVYPDTPLAWVARQPDEEEAARLRKALRNAVSIGGERSFDQDPRFGLAVMSEIGSRALSPATNDPGTAIDVIGRSTRLLWLWAQGCLPPSDDEEQKKPRKIRYPRVHVPPLRSDDLFEDAFMLMARDGAGLVEVQLRLQKALLALSRMGDDEFKHAALHQAKLASARSDTALVLEADKTRLRKAIAEIEAIDIGDAPTKK